MSANAAAMPNWPELTMALGLALVVAYVIADRVARLMESGLRAILPDERETRLIDRPKSIMRVLLFLVTAATLIFPAMRLVGYDMNVGGSPESLRQWLAQDGLRITLRIAGIALTAYVAVRFGAAAARRFEREMSTGTGLDVVERTKRARTLGAMLQKTFSVVVISIAALIALRELDVDITPVLTGAGIVGLAVGFGAQTLVRDVISGFFLILEDQVRVGDVAVVNGQGGLVEAVNLRTIVLRDEEGTVHVVPNGEVKTLSNRSKDFSYYVITIGIPFDTAPDAVITAMQDAGAALQRDPAFQPQILAPIEVYGIDDFKPGQLVIKGRIKTVPLKQWVVGRELRKHIAATFNARGIDLPIPQMNVTVENLDVLRPKESRN